MKNFESDDIQNLEALSRYLSGEADQATRDTITREFADEESPLRTFFSGSSTSSRRRRTSNGKKSFPRTIPIVVVGLACLAAGYALHVFTGRNHTPIAGEISLTALAPIATSTLAGPDEIVEVKGLSHFVVGGHFKLAIQSPKPGRLTVMIVDENAVRIYAPDATVVSSQTMETDAFVAPTGRETIFVFVTPSPCENVLRETFSSNIGFPESQIPDVRRRAIEAVNKQEFVIIGQITVEARDK